MGRYFNIAIFTAVDNFSRSDCREIRSPIGLLTKFYERHSIGEPIENLAQKKF